MPRLPWITLGVAALALGLAASDTASAWAELNRTAVAQGELWRLWTGHLAHFGGRHLGWDVGAWVVLGSWVERRSRGRLAGLAGAAASACAAAFWWGAPELTTYRGLSGLDSALFGAVASDWAGAGGAQVAPARRWLALAAWLGFAGKIAYELATQAPLFVGPPALFVPVPCAHLAGLATGTLCALAHPCERFAREDTARVAFPSLTPPPRPDSFPTEVP